MRKLFPRIVPFACSLFLVVSAACATDEEPAPAGSAGASGRATGGAGISTGGSAGGGASAGTGGSSGAAGSTAGKGGSSGASGSSAGAGGSSGAAGAAAGTGGSSGAAGASAGGSSGGSGASAGSAGSSGASGASAGGGGTAGAAGAGGASGGAAGSSAGAGGEGGAAISCEKPGLPAKFCTTAADCSVVRGPSQCATDYVGLQKGAAASYEAAAAFYRSCAPPPPCAADLPDRADDGSRPLAEGATATVRCDVGQCVSSFISDCAAVPAFPEACVEASDCAAVDQPDCCSTRVRGVSTAEAQKASETFAAFVESCRACEVVDCAGGGRVADDGTMPPQGSPLAPAKVACTAGKCVTSFNLGPAGK